METSMKPIQPTTRGVLVIDEPTEFIDRSLPTASWWIKYMLTPGEYPIELVTLNFTPWVPGKTEVGMVAPSAAYYAVVKVPAMQIESYVENRLLGHTSSHLDTSHSPAVVTLTTYAYNVKGGESYWGGRMVVPAYREDAYPVLASLHNDEYAEALEEANGWLADCDLALPEHVAREHTNVWNRIEREYEGGVRAFVANTILPDEPCCYGYPASRQFMHDHDCPEGRK